MVNSEKKKLKWTQKVVRVLHYPSVTILIVIGLILSVMLLINAFELVRHLIAGHLENRQAIEEIFIMLLMIEIIAAIKIYFSQHFHFPLRFILYIGITDIIRHIIIQLDDAGKLLYYAIALVLTVLALCMLEIKNTWIERNKPEKQNHIEL